MVITNRTQGRGFTLVELLLVIAIISIIAVAVTISINPVEMLKRGRDSQRISDLNQISLAVTAFVNSTTTPTMDNNTNTNCSDGASPKIFVSVPSNIATSSAPGLPSGWNWGQASLGSYRNTDATGWVPINFNGLAGGSPLPTLPIDPLNVWSATQNYFYAYICKSNGQYELEAYLESKNYSLGRAQDKTSTDGGRDPYMFETGSNFSLSPLSPVGAWLMNEGSGLYAYDTSGNNNTGTLSGTTTPTWITTNCKEGSCLSFNSSGSYVEASSSNSLAITGNMTIEAWINVVDFATYRGIVGKTSGGIPAPYDFYLFSGTGIPNFLRGNGTVYAIVAAANAPTLNTWQHIAVTMSGTSVTHYLNGALNGSGTLSTTIGDANKTFRVGSRDDLVTQMKGLMDDILIYNRPLSAAEVLQQYNTLK